MNTAETRNEAVKTLPLATPITPVERERLIEDLHRRYAGVLYGKCLRMLRDPTQAEDAVQEAFLIAYRVTERIVRLPSRLHVAWLHQTCTYVCLRELRKRRRHPLSTESNNSDEVVGLQTSPLEELEVAELVQRVMASLDMRSREIVQAHFIEGRTQEEIAPQLTISRRAVVKRLSKIRAQFAAAFWPGQVREGATA